MRNEFLSMMWMSPDDWKAGPGSHPSGFESGINPLIKRYFDELGERCPAELREYASTSMPLEDFTTYLWTFYSASTMAETIPELEIFQQGYFPFAVADSNYVAISIDDGQVYSSTETDRKEHEATSLIEFMRLTRQLMLDDLARG